MNSLFFFYLTYVYALMQQKNASKEEASRDRSPHGKRTNWPSRFRGLTPQEHEETEDDNDDDDDDDFI